MSGQLVIKKEMGITHKEFFRNIPRALGTGDYVTRSDGVTLDDGERNLEISISEESKRRIALFSLPVTHVTLTFTGYGSAETARFMEKFDLAFQRGGG